MATKIVPIGYIKAALGITGSSEDTLLTQLEEKAAAWVEEQLGQRRFQVPAETTEYLEGKNSSRLILKGHAHGDQAVTVTERFSSGGAARPFTDFERRGDVLVRTDGQPWYAAAEYAVTYQDGYPEGQAPGDVQQLVVSLVEKMRDTALESDGIVSETIGDYSYTLDASVAVGGKLTDTDQRTLDRWRRMSI